MAAVGCCSFIKNAKAYEAQLDIHSIISPCRHYDAKRIYGTTKLANLLMAKELARRLKPHNVVSNAVHPGSVQTDLFRNIPFLGHVVYQIMGILFKSAKVEKDKSSWRVSKIRTPET